MLFQILQGEFCKSATAASGDIELTFNWRQANCSKFLSQGSSCIEQQAA